MSHPTTADLALLAGGDLGIWHRLRLRLHLRSCETCRQEYGRFLTTRRWVDEHGVLMPAGVTWDRLAADMKANIRLGLAAGACVPEARLESPLGWRAAAALVSVTLLIISGWFLHVPRPRFQASAPAAGEIVLAATPAGIELSGHGASLTLVHRSAEIVTVSAGARDSLRARYVDQETGQVMIHHVYAE